MLAHETHERSRAPLRWWEWTVRCALVAAMLCVVPLAAFSMLGNVSPTATQAALAGWLLWGVPVTAFAADRFSTPAPRVFHALLAGGWGATLVACAVAAVTFTGYPSSGPHEAIAIAFFALSVLAHAGWATWSLSQRGAPETGRRRTQLAIVFVAVLGGGLAWAGFTDSIEVRLPVFAYPIDRYGYHDMMGENSLFVRAPMSAADFEEYRLSLGLTENTPDTRSLVRAIGKPQWAKDVAFDEVWSAPQPGNTDQSWCWRVATWKDGFVWASSGCGWM